MRNRTFWAVFLWAISLTPATGQQIIHGEVVDARTGEPVSFAAVLVNPATRTGVVAGLDGRFATVVAQLSDSLAATCLGYTPLRDTWAALPQRGGRYVIELTPRELSIREVEITTFRNPGETIMRRVIRNRKLNDPAQLSAYTCRSYSKFIFDFMPASRDTTGWSTEEKKLAVAADTMNLMIMESVTERRFRRPALVEEKIIGTKVSGLKRPSFAALATDLQPFSFYEPYISLLDQSYVSPVHPRYWKQYQFFCRDTLLRESDSLYMLEFLPKNGADFKALKGFLHISSLGYALADIQAAPAAEGPAQIQIQQVYDRPDGLHWFPKALLVSLKFNQNLTPKMGVQLSGETTYRDVEIGLSVPKKNFGITETFLAKGAANRSIAFWDSVREEPLTFKEVNTYQFVDSIGEIMKLDKVFRWLEYLARGYVPFGKVSISLRRLMQFNVYEGFRPGIGLRPTQPIMGRVYPEVWAAYGFRDQAFKYGGSLEIWLDKQFGDWRFTATAGQEVEEIGRPFIRWTPSLPSTRNLLATQVDSMRYASLSLSGRLLKSFTFQVGWFGQERQPTYEYIWNDEAFPNIAWQEARLQGRLAIGERYIESFGMRLPSRQPWPVLEGLYVRAWGQTVDFSRAELRLSYAWNSGLGGRTSFLLIGGKLWGQAPVSQAFFLPSVRAEQIGWLYVPNHFQTATPYEFAADTYAALFASRLFGISFFNTRRSRPQPEISQHVGFGLLNEAAQQGQPGQSPLQAPRFGLYESGLMLHNLLRMNYVDVGYMGLSAGAFLRWGPHSLPDGWRNNVIFKAGFIFRLN